MAVVPSKTELMAAIRGLSAARELPPEVILEALKAALKSAYDKIPERRASEVAIDINESTGSAHVYGNYAVTEAAFIEDPLSQLTVDAARRHKDDAQVGDLITLDVTPGDFGRIAAQTAKQVILQRIREAEREQTYLTYADREGEIVYGTVQTVNRDVVTVAMDRVEAILPRREQIPGERYTPNQRLRIYVAEVKRAVKGPQIIVSRAHKQMLLRLMELEIPELFQGAVEAKAIAREAGNRSKVAVWSHQEGVDPVGACVGMRGVRIQTLVRELGGEKIDIVEWDPDPRVFIKNALSPARVMYVSLEPNEEEEAGPIRGTAAVIVPDDQLSLAIGREGQNARLAAKLTGWRIDIRAESESADLLEKLRAEDEIRRAERARRLAAEREKGIVEQPLPAVVPAEVAPGADEESTTPLEIPAPDEIAATVTHPAEVAVEQVPAAAATDVAVEARDSVDGAVDVETTVEDDGADQAVTVEVGEADVAPAAAAASDESAVDTTVAPEALRPGRVKKAGDEDDDELALDHLQPKRKARRLIRDPKTGQVYAEVRRKRSRRDWRDDVEGWTGEDDFDFDEDAMAFTEDDFLVPEQDDGEDQPDGGEGVEDGEGDEQVGAAETQNGEADEPDGGADEEE